MLFSAARHRLSELGAAVADAFAADDPLLCDCTATAICAGCDPTRALLPSHLRAALPMAVGD